MVEKIYIQSHYFIDTLHVGPYSYIYNDKKNDNCNKRARPDLLFMRT